MENCIFKEKELEQLISDFYDSTGIAITLYDADGRIIATSHIFCSYCAFLRSNPKCLAQCDRSNALHIKEAEQTKSAVTYCCHAGNTELIQPIFYEDTVIAYLQIGQFHDEQGKYSSREAARHLAQRYGMEEDLLLALYDQVATVSDRRIEALQNILNVLIQAFWAQGLIHYNRSMLSVKIESYILEHLTEKLCIQDICRRFLLSQSGLYRLFAEEFHTTVNEFITRKRLDQAKDLLQGRQNLNITQIASLCGFPDHNYFIRVFRRRYGLTPLQYRKTMPVSEY